MPANPYDEDEQKRQAQIGQLRDPVSTTMPVGARPQVSVVGGPAPSGWDAGNWADPNMHSVKYDAGRLLYGKSKPSEIGSIVSGGAFQQRFPGATFDGKDNIDFKGALSDGDRGSPVGLIDVLMGADANTDSSNGIWWGAPDGATGSQTARTPVGPNPLMDNSAITKIIAELGAASKDEQSPAEREAVLAMLQGGV